MSKKQPKHVATKSGIDSKEKRPKKKKTKASQAPAFLDCFDDREIHVLRLFSKGMTRPEVAVELDVSEALVKAIITRILKKTGYKSILRLVVFLTSSGYMG